ncbi:uncharacterized protein MCYG_01641 [Microsporum canis CBS 113480]|uniref:Uncharacterized protein n=1 Tax=Arthroderma otae (strain ATCC MYA-4605 / CBS 113480) TaxID=554155 RepID=C5FHA3_ARTOC|nr:uncharacterized protein MCYG_01641 [Microsporum canis CBS 113480]EEQ28822.1 predicted protein [Microsporum canis CBS 113480]
MIFFSLSVRQKEKGEEAKVSTKERKNTSIHTYLQPSTWNPDDRRQDKTSPIRSFLSSGPAEDRAVDVLPHTNPKIDMEVKWPEPIPIPIPIPSAHQVKRASYMPLLVRPWRLRKQKDELASYIRARRGKSTLVGNGRQDFKCIPLGLPWAESGLGWALGLGWCLGDE